MFLAGIRRISKKAAADRTFIHTLQAKRCLSTPALPEEKEGRDWGSEAWILTTSNPFPSPLWNLHLLGEEGGNVQQQHGSDAPSGHSISHPAKPLCSGLGR